MYDNKAWGQWFSILILYQVYDGDSNEHTQFGKKTMAMKLIMIVKGKK